MQFVWHGNELKKTSESVMGLPFPIGPIQDMNISGITQLRREGSVAWSSSVSNKLWVIYLSHRVQDKRNSNYPFCSFFFFSS